MENIEKWKPTKFIYNKKGHLVANREYVSITSLLVANKAAILYQKNIKKNS